MENLNTILEINQSDEILLRNYYTEYFTKKYDEALDIFINGDKSTLRANKDNMFFINHSDVTDQVENTLTTDDFIKYLVDTKATLPKTTYFDEVCFCTDDENFSSDEFVYLCYYHLSLKPKTTIQDKVNWMIRDIKHKVKYQNKGKDAQAYIKRILDLRNTQ